MSLYALDRTDRIDSWRRSLLLLLFFLSGLCGLIYEVIWTRMLTVVFGATVFAISTVLTAFMGGLALGSFVFGRLVDRWGHPLRMYGMLEIGIGVYALLIPVLFIGLEWLYAQIYSRLSPGFYELTLIRFVLSCTVLLMPAALMGGTLPVLSHVVVRDKAHRGQEVGVLYGVNTLGAVFGTMGAGFVFIPIIGVQESVYAAAGLNVLIGLVVILGLGRREGRCPSAPVSFHPPARKQGGAFLLLVYGFSGFCTLSCEVLWTRALSMVLGTSTYAFTLILATFLVGLAVGGVFGGRLIDRSRYPTRVLAMDLIGIGLLVLGTISLFRELPFLYARLAGEVRYAWWVLTGVKFMLLMLVMLPPTLLMGAIFPMVSRLYTRQMDHLGSRIGAVYAAGTVGSVVGSFTAGFLLMPLLGLRWALIGMVYIPLALGGLVALLGHIGKAWSRWILFGGSALLGLVIVLFPPRWASKVISAGVYYREQDVSSPMDLRTKLSFYNLLYYRDGVEATVAVYESQRARPPVRTMRINGKPVASTDYEDMRIQRMLAHLPLLLHTHPRRVLVVGLGTGVTFGAVGRHDVVEADCVEISPAVIDGARWFAAENGHILEDPRAHVILQDAFNYLAFTPTPYDVITSDPIHPWVAGGATLYMAEYYTRCRAKLRDGGIMAQWLPLYQLSPDDIRMIVRTFRSVFPHTTLWYTNTDLILIGAQRRLSLDLQRLRARIGDPDIQGSLREIHFEDPLTIASSLLLDEEGVAHLAAEAPLNTVNHPRLEFSAPKSMYARVFALNLQTVFEAHTEPLLDLVGATSEDKEQLKSYRAARLQFIQGKIALAQGKTREAVKHLRTALEAHPSDRDARKILVAIYLEQAKKAYREGHYAETLAELEQAHTIQPENIEVLSSLALLYTQARRFDEAISLYRDAIKVAPADPDVHNELGLLYRRIGRHQEAIAEYRRAIAIQLDFAPAYFNLGDTYAEVGDVENAVKAYRRALALVDVGSEIAQVIRDRLKRVSASGR